jgi:hypothetical protein
MLEHIVLQASIPVSQFNATNASAFYVATAATYTENTVEVLLTMITVLALSVQIARAYFIRILRKFTLRVAADIWWLVYVILRDASIFLVVFLGVMLFWPGIYEDFPIAMPFAPLAVDFYAFALVLILVVDTEDNSFYNSLVSIFVIIGSLLYIVGVVLVTESPVALGVLPPTVSANTTNIWGYANQYLNSVNNPTLAIYTFYITGAILGLCGLIAILYSFKGGILNRFIEPKARPIVKDVPSPQVQKPQ